jgi:hypothetical protein
MVLCVRGIGLYAPVSPAVVLGFASKAPLYIRINPLIIHILIHPQIRSIMVFSGGALGKVVGASRVRWQLTGWSEVVWPWRRSMEKKAGVDREVDDVAS